MTGQRSPNAVKVPFAALARRWLSGDERTLGLVLGVGVLVSLYFQVAGLRGQRAAEPALGLVVVLLAVAWSTLLSRAFVRLEPAVLTWHDFGGTARSTVVTRRLLVGWVWRTAAVGYVVALLGVYLGAPAGWWWAGFAAVGGSGLLVLALARRARTAPLAEAGALLAVAGLAVGMRPAAVVVLVVGAVLAVPAVLLLIRPGPRVAEQAGRAELVDGWRERMLRDVGVAFLDVGLLLPAARPVPGWALTGTVRLTVLGVAARARFVPFAVLLALATAAAHLAFAALPDLVLLAAVGYVAVVPFAGGLGLLWRSAGLRRWTGGSDLGLRLTGLAVLGVVAAAWLGLVLGVAALAGAPVSPLALVAVPVVAAGAVRMVTRQAPSYDDIGETVTPFGTVVPVRLVYQTTRGPDVAALAVLLVHVLPPVAGAVVVAVAVAGCVLR
jgi:hypothetical protein